jgi:hypothetical protein
MLRPIRIGAVIAGLLVISPSAVPAVSIENAVMEWNRIALSATVTANQGALPQVRSMTIVHVSVNDAVNAVTGRHRTYLVQGAAPAGASAEAAAIAAAHKALVTLFPPQTVALDAARVASLAARSLTETDPGIAVGESAAAAILTARASDGAAVAQFPYTAPDAGTPGVWHGCGAVAGMGTGDAMGPGKRVAIPARWSAIAGQPAVGARLRRGQVPWRARQHHAHRRTDRNCPLLAGDALRDLEQRSAQNHRGSRPRCFGHGARAGAHVSRGRRRLDRVLGREVCLQLLASSGGHPEWPPRWQPLDHRRSRVDALVPDAATSGIHLRPRDQQQRNGNGPGVAVR